MVAFIFLNLDTTAYIEISIQVLPGLTFTPETHLPITSECEFLVINVD